MKTKRNNNKKKKIILIGIPMELQIVSVKNLQKDNLKLKNYLKRNKMPNTNNTKYNKPKKKWNKKKLKKNNNKKKSNLLK